MNDLNRRDVLKAGIGAGVALTLGGTLPSSLGRKIDAAAPADPNAHAVRKRVLRIAHLTDVHVQPELAAAEGLAACLRHVQSQKDRPDIIFNGGDAIMDSLAQHKDRTQLQWDLWKKVLKNDCSLPVEHCIGNHDVWGWDRAKSGCSGNENLYGKKWAVDEFGISGRYRSFDRAGWHFIVLDSTHPDKGVYIARLDEPQFEWLQEDLQRTDPETPILVMSHIPILSASAFYDGDLEKTGTWEVPAAWMHIDSRRFKNVFLRHPNVKACLSGHLHLVDRVDYSGVTYFCNGAVSGNWWKGRHYECDAGYAVVDLFSDGSVEREYVLYGWRPRK